MLLGSNYRTPKVQIKYPDIIWVIAKHKDKALSGSPTRRYAYKGESCDALFSGLQVFQPGDFGTKRKVSTLFILARITKLFPKTNTQVLSHSQNLSSLVFGSRHAIFWIQGHKTRVSRNPSKQAFQEISKRSIPFTMRWWYPALWYKFYACNGF